VKKTLTPETAYPKIKHYCGYSERCHTEVREKLYGMGLFRKDVETLLSRLIEEDYLNEERYATLFAGGHFRQKKWGKQKIIFALRQKKISEPNIRRSLQSISTEDYTKTLAELVKKRWQSLKGEQYLVRQAKTLSYLQGRGFETELIRTEMEKVRTANRD
jgi:regulatory protein